MFLLLGGVVAFLMLKGGMSPATKAGTTAVANHTTAQTTKSPSSAAAPRATNGAQANQPWYVGPEQAAGGQAASLLVSGAKSLISSFGSNTPEDVPDESDDGVDADSVTTAQNDMGQFDAGNLTSDEGYDPTIDTSTEETSNFDSEYA